LIVAAELGTLFQELQNTRASAVKPAQRLALAALKNSKWLENDGERMLKNAAKSSEAASAPTPPPLPARKSPAPPVPPRQSQSPQVTVNLVSELETAETASTVSSHTLVNQAEDGSDQSYVKITAVDAQSDDGKQDTSAHGAETKEAIDGSKDVVMVDADSEPEISVESKIAAALNDSSVSGTDQQDVEEVMGNIIGHLRAAIKATGEDETLKIQRDPVMDLFFWTVASYSRTAGEKAYRQIECSPNRWATAFPNEDGQVIGLLQALDRNFQRESIKEKDIRLERFSSIVRLPPVLHIHIQRTLKGGGKNNTPINIPETLFLDRFMDADPESERFKRRQRSWDLSERIRSLNGPELDGGKAQANAAPPATLAVYDQGVVEEFFNDGRIEAEDLGYEVITDEVRELLNENGIPTPNYPALDSGDDMGVTVESIKEAFNPDLAKKFQERSRACEQAYRSELEGLFEDMKDEEYCLHAVICHAGQTGRSGHYWVWIFDFEKNVWRKYNDSSVTEQPDKDEVMKELCTRGEPYYLAYVRREDVGRLVNIPTRVATAPVEPEALEPDDDARKQISQEGS
jgi:ubiquitin carboxyl-terminal hydrolase 25